jgi:hypothetical protein
MRNRTLSANPTGKCHATGGLADTAVGGCNGFVPPQIPYANGINCLPAAIYFMAALKQSHPYFYYFGQTPFFLNNAKHY